MIYFRNDYSEGAHPKVLQALVETNLVSTPGYGCDEYCACARELLRERFACPNADVHFLVGGTQTNLTAAAAFLRPWEAIIAADTGHIAVHETGAIEATGHKVYVVPGVDGKLTSDAIRTAVRDHQTGTEEHMVLPRMVYVSDSTELGTIYTRAELQALSDTCRELGLYLYLDGARMAMALTAQGNDLVPEDFAQLCDAFYLGGTKNALLFGEALVIVNNALKPYFRNVMKQHGGMLAKGRLLGVQFAAILQDDLWLQTARHANELAQRLAAALTAMGVPLYAASPTNQVFPIFTNAQVEALRQNFSFEFIARVDENHSAIRFVTSWATRPEDVETLLEAVRSL
ncbi:MAG: aminotransferase class I/II-fold pyridoxal phosphate-dependent enzyme [Clostridiales bacterium]|nr:aminotransferase class I/II-fold pyridoxal phosphate-dependent enzyme [Clostridiales bacterium]MDD6936476.1 aminotransferase class I/II-fold pyridoxal phosphate-dependent enzyme [Clostridiales bacterium]MDY2962389.1 aminotransferase class I/II-fold pyridoxal phosphate-dependent enzyme [Oscillospiraceae bacterium]